MTPRPLTRLQQAISLLILTYSASAAAQGGVCPAYDLMPGVDISTSMTRDGAQTERETNDQPVHIATDNVSWQLGGISHLTGDVHLQQGDRSFTAQQIDMDQQAQTVTIGSESLFSSPDLIIRSERANFDLTDKSGVFSDTQFALPSNSARGRSDSIQVAADGKATLKDTSYSTCPPGAESWYLKAGTVKLDHNTGLGKATDVSMHFLGVPLFWLPYLQFPIDDQRRTGLLFPTIGQSDRTGFDMSWPVYINLAPNYDATITPHYMGRRGMEMGGSFRYLLAEGEGSASARYLDHDDVYGSSRSLIKFDHVGLLNDRLSVDSTYSRVSDREYFHDLGGSLDTSALTVLERRARLIYQSPGAYRIQAMVQDFQPIASTLTSEEDPYQRLPQIKLDALTPHAWHGWRMGFNGEAVNFAKENAIEGSRFDLQPFVRYDLDHTDWYVTSQADWRYTAYDLKNLEYADDGEQHHMERSLPVISAESGLRFERFTDRGWLQTLEPSAFVLYAPYRHQDDLPIFDTGEPDFDFVQLFARNRFSGADRISDAELLAGKLTTRLLDPESGQQRLSASVGQLFRFETPKVTLPGIPPPVSGATEFITQIDYRLMQNWSVALDNQWSAQENEIERNAVRLSYRDADTSKRLDIAYRYRRDTLEQSDVAVSWPVYGGFQVTARQRYSFPDSRSLENMVGVRYETCCWALTTTYRHYIVSNSSDYDSGIYLQLELRGLGSVGTETQKLLPVYEAGDE